jgi:outer membrane lipoprotein-sorting protein
MLLARAADVAADQNALLDGWFAAQTKVQTWSADFIQTRRLAVLAQPLQATGKVWVAIPDRFRWELGQPAQTIALRQPNQLFIIYPRFKRAEKYPLSPQRPGPWQDALALLEAGFPRRRAELESRFRLLSVTHTNAMLQLALAPRSASARRFMREIQVRFRTNDFSLAATEVTFSDGARLCNDFTNAVLNPRLPDGCFDASLEPDFTLVEPLGR